MSAFPRKRTYPVAGPVLEADEAGVDYVENNHPYAHDDTNVTADYATDTEFQNYDDPDSIADIVRDQVEKYYVGTRDPKLTITPLRVLPEQIVSGSLVAQGPVYLYGWQMSHFLTSVYGIGIWDGIQETADPTFLSIASARTNNVLFSAPVLMSNIYVKGLFNTDEAFVNDRRQAFTLLIGRVK